MNGNDNVTEYEKWNKTHQNDNTIKYQYNVFQ